MRYDRDDAIAHAVGARAAFGNGVVRLSCLQQTSNTCGQRAAFNALCFLAHPDNLDAAEAAMLNVEGLKALGDLELDVFDRRIEPMVRGQNIPVIEHLGRAAAAIGGDAAPELAGQALLDFVAWNDHDRPARARRMIALVLHTGHFHWIAIRLRWRDDGSIEVVYADSLAQRGDPQRGDPTQQIDGLLEAIGLDGRRFRPAN